MAESNRSTNLTSKLESKIASRILATLAPVVAGEPKAVLRQNQRLPQMVENWSQYSVNELPEVLGIGPSDHIPQAFPFWASPHTPAFKFRRVKIRGTEVEEVVWNKGGHGQRDRDLWNKRMENNPGFEEAAIKHLRWVRQLGRIDPAAKKFVEAYLNSKSKEEMLARLKEDYPKTTWLSPFNMRMQFLMATELDFVMTEQYGWDTPMTAVDDRRREVPRVYVGVDGMIGACQVAGKVVNSPLMVASDGILGQRFRYKSGRIDNGAVEKRLRGFRDKSAIMENIRIPTVILPHIAATVTENPESPLIHTEDGTPLNTDHMAADIAIFHACSIASYIRHPRYLDDEDSWTERQRAHFVASTSLAHPCLKALNTDQNIFDVQLESIDMELPEGCEEEVLYGHKPDSSTKKKLIDEVYLRHRMERYGYTTDTHLEALGLNREKMPALRLTAQHQHRGEQTVELMLVPGLGCNIHPELDYLQMAGLAAATAIRNFNEVD